MFAMRGFSFAGYGLSGSPGWFANSGELALEMVVMFSMSLSILIAFRDHVRKSIRWWILVLLFPGTAAMTVIGSSSRGGQLALAAVIIFYFVRGRQVIKRAAIIAILAYIGQHVLPEEQLERFSTAGSDETSELRLQHWEHAMEVIEKNPFGIGYKNWIPYYAAIYHPEVLEQIHNTFLQTFVDLGYPGGVLFLVMIVTSFIMNIKTSREMNGVGGDEERSIAAVATGINLGLLGTLIAAFFMSVLWYPMFWLAFAMTSALRHVSQNRLKVVKNSLMPFKPKQIETS
jgi:O-antigen ligase